MARAALLAGPLVAAVLLSGCSLGGSDAPTLHVAFTTNWSPGHADFLMSASEALPADFKVVLLEKETGLRQEVRGDRLTLRLPDRFDVPSVLQLHDGNTYRVEGFVGGDSVGSREVKADATGLDKPAEASVRATYAFRLAAKAEHGDARQTMALSGTAAMEAAQRHTTFRMDGSGAFNVTAGSLAQRLTVSSFTTEERDGNVTKSLMLADGDWTLTGSPSGSGKTTFRMEFQGREGKADASGVLRPCEKSATTTDFTGSFTAEGQTLQYQNHSVETTWSRVDDGTDVWRSVTWSASYTAQGQSIPDNGHKDGPATQDDDGADTDLLDVVDFEGFQPFPLAEGDQFLEAGKEGVTIQYAVADGGAREAAGQPVQSLKVTGTVASGASGTETWYLARDGALATLPLAWSHHYQKGGETADSSADLVALA